MKKCEQTCSKKVHYLKKPVDIAMHEHEVYDEDEDQYSRTCKTCDHVHSYEKM